MNWQKSMMEGDQNEERSTLSFCTIVRVWHNTACDPRNVSADPWWKKKGLSLKKLKKERIQTHTHTHTHVYTHNLSGFLFPLFCQKKRFMITSWKLFSYPLVTQTFSLPPANETRVKMHSSMAPSGGWTGLFEKSKQKRINPSVRLRGGKGSINRAKTTCNCNSDVGKKRSQEYGVK